MRRGSVRIGILRHLTIRSSRPHVVASAACFTLRLHASAAPPRVGLTQALGAMVETEMATKIQEMQRLAQELMPMLLQGDDPRLGLLRQQWLVATVSISNASSSGFYVDIVIPSDASRVDAPDQGGGNAVIPVNGYDQPAGCILYIADGALHFLEVYNFTAWETPPHFGPPSYIEPFAFAVPATAAGHGT